MKAYEGVIGGISATAAYLAAPDVLNKVQTVCFLGFVFAMSVAAIWAYEELCTRIRRARRIARRKRIVHNIDFSRTGMVEEETGREVMRTS